MAIEDYTSAIKNEPDNRNYWYNRAACYMESGEYDRAQEQLDTIISKWSTFAAPYLLKSETYLHQKDTTKATEWIDKSLKIDEYNVSAWRVRANIALYKEQWNDADTFFSKVLHLAPKDCNSYINRALARLRINNLRGAMSDYNIALEINPNSFLGHYNRGLLRQQVGDDNRAIEDFNYVLELEPDNIMALVNRATLLDRTGNLRAAVRDYSQVISKFPNFITGLQRRAQCYRKLGSIGDAEKDEFRILKIQMDKHLGIQQRWSKSKLNAMRKLSDVDPEKYDQNVIEDQQEQAHEYKSEYRGKVQNRQVTESYMPYIVMTTTTKQMGMSSYVPFDKSVEDYIGTLSSIVGKERAASLLPKLGFMGEGTGVSTFDVVDGVTALIQQTRDSEAAIKLLLLRAVAYASAQNYEEARKDVDNILAIEPDNMLALWQNAVCGAMIAEYEHGQTPIEQQMRTAGAFLRQLKLLVPEDRAVGAGLRDLLLAGGLLRVDDHEAVLPAVDRAVFRRGHAGGVPTVIAQPGDVVDAHLGDGALDVIRHPAPELPRQGLGLGVGGPVVLRVLVLAGQLAVIAAGALGHVDHERFRHYLAASSPPTIQPAKHTPASGSICLAKAAG